MYVFAILNSHVSLFIKFDLSFFFLKLGSKPKSKPKREKTQEEKTFKRKAKYFVVAQLVAVVVFLTLMTSFDDAEVELDDDGGYDFDEWNCIHLFIFLN